MDLTHNGVVMEGWLEKKGHFRKNWKLRYVQVKGNKLSYYTDQDMTTKKGDITLDIYTRVLSRDGRSHSFKFGITNSSSFLELCADSAELRHRWIQALKVHLGQEAPSDSIQSADQCSPHLGHLSGQSLIYPHKHLTKAGTDGGWSCPRVLPSLDDSDNASSARSDDDMDAKTDGEVVIAAEQLTTYGNCGAATLSSVSIDSPCAIDEEKAVAVDDGIAHLLPDLLDLL